jgi:AraC-like DNA-binding protein
MVYDPLLCLILQGGKSTLAGEQVANLGPGDALLVSHDLPVISRITKASLKSPYMALILVLDLTLLRSLHDEVVAANGPSMPCRSFSFGPVDPATLEPLKRYMQLMDDPLDAKVLGPSILREIYFRLLSGSQGGTLRTLLIADSHANRVASAIAMLRKNFRNPLGVTDLARKAGMSPSSFFHHFKAVTGRTPGQYQKDLRLIEAHARLLDRIQSVAQVAYAVGYESPTHFSRDYKRKFGVPPSRAGTVPSRKAFQDQMNERQPRQAVSLSSSNLA